MAVDFGLTQQLEVVFVAEVKRSRTQQQPISVEFRSKAQPTPQFNNNFSVQLQLNYGAIFFGTFIVVSQRQKIKKDIIV